MMATGALKVSELPEIVAMVKHQCGAHELRTNASMRGSFIVQYKQAIANHGACGKAGATEEQRSPQKKPTSSRSDKGTAMSSIKTIKQIMEGIK